MVFSNRDFVNLRAEAGLGLLNEGVLIAKGVRVERPNLTAEALVVDLKGREALAYGRFSLTEGQRILRASNPSAKLLLRFGFGRLRAETHVPAGHRLFRYLGKL